MIPLSKRVPAAFTSFKEAVNGKERLFATGPESKLGIELKLLSGSRRKAQF